MRVVKHLYGAIGAIVTVASFLSLLTLPSVRHWVGGHPYELFSALVVTLGALVATADYVYVVSVKRREEHRASDSTTVTATEHDKRLYATFLKALPRDGKLLSWLKNWFIETSVYYNDLRELERQLRHLQTNPIGFDDADANAGYQRLLTAIEEFIITVSQWTWSDKTDIRLDVPPEWRGSSRDADYEQAVNEIAASRRVLIDAYDGLLKLCHQAGIDEP